MNIPYQLKDLLLIAALAVLIYIIYRVAELRIEQCPQCGAEMLEYSDRVSYCSKGCLS